MPLVMMTSEAETFGGVLIAGDDYLMGLEAGRAAGQIIRDEMGGHADVIILDYPDLEYLVTRADGLEAGVLEVAPEAHIVGRYLGATADNGQQSVSNLIAEGVHFDVILSINDAGSYGAIAAMEAADFDPGFGRHQQRRCRIGGARLHPRRAFHARVGRCRTGSCFRRPPSTRWSSCWQARPCPEIYLVPPGQVVTRDTLGRRERRN